VTDSDKPAPSARSEIPAPMSEGRNSEHIPAPIRGTEPPPPALPGQEDLLGRRIAAALIDLALLTGLGLILGLTVGESSVGGGSYSVFLNGAWLLLYLGATPPSWPRRKLGTLSHNYVGTEHLLLGLIHEGEGVPAKARWRRLASRWRPCAPRWSRSSAAGS
jgi:Clp amino terminal domain, pathogenicity island component